MKDDKFLLILIGILAFLSFLILKPFLTYVLFSAILAVVAYPLYEKIKSKLRFAPLAALVIIITIIIIIIVPSIYLTVSIFTQSRDILYNIGASEFTQLQKIEDKLEEYFNMEFNFAETIRVWILDFSSTIRPFIIGNIVTLTRTIANFVAGVVLMFFLMFYLFIDGKKIIAQIKEQMPMDKKYKNHLFNRLYQTIQGLFLGLFLTAVLQGVAGGLGYFLFGMPNAVLLGFLTGIVSLVPFLGAPAVYIPVSIFLLLQGSIIGGIGLLLYGIVILSNIDNLVRPVVVRVRSKVHPLYVILGVVGGVSFLGFSGIIIGPLILVLLQEALDVYRLTRKNH